MTPRGAMLLVAESTRQLREERETATLIARDGQGGTGEGETSLPDFVPCCYHPGGIFEDLQALAPELMRSPIVEGQTWENVEETRSTPSSVKVLLRECGGVGVTFLIPTKSQRPWSPPLGFQCVYDSYFQNETKLWFPIPRLVTSYARRRDAAMSQFLNGVFRILVALMVAAAEINVSMSVRTLEELTYVKSMGMDFDHPDSASYPEEFIANTRAVALLAQVSWKDITVERIRRVVERISKRDWRSDLLPLITGNRRRFSIFTRAEQKAINAAREMKELPNLSALIKKKLSGAKKTSSATPSETTPGEMTPSGPPPLTVSPGPSVDPVNIESSREDLVQSCERETVEPSVTDGNKKKRSAPDSSASVDARARTGSDEPPEKKKKKEKKKRKKSIEGQSEPIGDADGHEPVVHEGSSRDAATRAVVESSGSPKVPLEKKKKPSRGRDVSAFAAKTPSVAPPTTTGVVQPRRNVKSNFVIAWNSSMTATLHFLTLYRNVLSLFDKFEVAPRICLQLKISSSKTHMTNSKLPARRSEDSNERVTTALRHLKEVNWLRDSRRYEVTHERVRVQMAMIVKINHRFAKIRDLEKRHGDFETARSLQSQAFGTKKCLEALKEFESEAKRLTVGRIPEELLCLSPLHLPSAFLNENVLAAIDPNGSNTGLIDAGTAAFLQTPTSSQGDHATERSNEPTERELGESSVKGR
ncbi:hypothetical protein Bca52824_065248 [Brassica carinata]|uniref:Uncharacterized protein n=1 Tax=Brassica carinata TaxID=52824 RepID=A0A8X7QN18_BRACI|nr:hypothetical protein Bca52824_065248 [Brassica carinata]